MRGLSKRSIAKLTLATVSLCASITVCEFAVRAIRPGYSPLFLDIYCRDEQGLMALRPGLIRRHVTDEWDVTVAVNHEGLRDSDHAVADENATILGLGDSFAFGRGVGLNES